MTRPTALGQFAVVAIAAAAVLAALSVLLPALDAHNRLNDYEKTLHRHHQLPSGCDAAHEVLRDGQVFELCDLYRPTPQPAPSPRPKAMPT